MSVSDNLKRGTVELLLLTLLQEQDMYGYQLSQKLRKFFTRYDEHGKPTNIGTVHTFQGKEAPIVFFVLGADQQSRTRVYYHLEPDGATYLTQIRRDYFSVNRGVLNVLRTCGRGLAEDETL